MIPNILDFLIWASAFVLGVSLLWDTWRYSDWVRDRVSTVVASVLTVGSITRALFALLA